MTEFSDAKNAWQEQESVDSARAYIDQLEARVLKLRDTNRNLQSREAAYNMLTNLGMALEVTGHEVARIASDMSYGFQRLPVDVKSSEAGQLIASSHEELIAGFRHLNSNLSVSLTSMTRMTGNDIAEYLARYTKRFRITFTDAFLNTEFYARRNRVYPVLINLIGNAFRYTEKLPDGQIILDYANGEYIVADNGPGIDEIDQPFLYDPLFTKGSPFGRGVGLYHVKKSLETMMGEIRYITDESEKVLPGANFAVKICGLAPSQKS